MPEPTHYAQLTRARIAEEIWDEAYFALVSLKGYLQSMPGFTAMEILGRADDDGVSVLTIVRFALEDQLEQWLETGVTPQRVFEALEEKPTDVTTDYLLEMA